MVMTIVFYIIPAVISWILSRKYAIITGQRPSAVDLHRTLMPVLNVFSVFILMAWIREELPGKRSLIEAFYAIKTEDYWSKEAESEEK